MRLFLLASVLLIMTGCGDIKVTQPKDFVVKHQVDLENLEVYFRKLCEEELSQDGTYEPTVIEVDTCVDVKIAEFLDAIT